MSSASPGTGSSRGLGAAIARRLARDGLAVAVNGRGGRDAQVQAVARSISAESGTAGAFPADVTEEHEAAGLVAAISGTLGPVEVLVLNATGPQPEAPLSEVAWEPGTQLAPGQCRHLRSENALGSVLQAVP